MSRRTVDNIADELTNVITSKIGARCDAPKSVEVLIGESRMHRKSDAFRELTPDAPVARAAREDTRSRCQLSSVPGTHASGDPSHGRPTV